LSIALANEQVALVGGDAGARSEAQRMSWEQKSSQNVNFWRIRAHGENGVPNSMEARAEQLYHLGLIRKGLMKHAGLHMQALAKHSEDDPPFIGADIAGAMGNGRVSGGSTRDYFEPMATEDYGLWGPAMTFNAHDTVARRVRSMVDDDGVPMSSDSYVEAAQDKGFIKPLLGLPSDYATLDYDNGKSDIYSHTR